MKNTYLKFITACLFCLFISGIRAQDRPAIYHAGGGGLTIGYGTMDVSPLHNFVPGGVSSFSNNQLLIGGMGHGFLGNFVIGGSGSAIIGDKIKTGANNYSLGGGVGTFDFGYLVVNRPKIRLFPLLGVGGGGYGIQITENSSVSAADIRTDPAREINISQGSFVLDFSLNLNVIPVLVYHEKDRSYGGFMTGLKVGYLYGLSSSDWRYSGGDVTGGPDFGLNMFYVKLIIGGFGYSE
jgi:hypothetical protein